MDKHLLSNVSIDSIEQQIRNLNVCDKQSVSINVFKQQLSQLIQGYSCITISIDAPYIFRARKTNPERLFSQVTELWYPPADKILRYGRLNNIGSSLFYSADTEDTALYEMRPQVGDLYTILRCRLKDPGIIPHVMELGIAERSSQYDHPLRHSILENTVAGREFLRDEGNIKSNLAIRTFLAKEFTRIVEPGNEFEYKITIALAEILMDSDRIDGVCYPSIATKTGSNLTLKPTSVDRLYEADDSWVLRIEQDLRPQGFQVLCVAKAKSISSDGAIKW
jgi:hypothetical protein